MQRLSADSQVVPAAYWEGRARKFAACGRGLAAVCSYGMPAFYNYYIEYVQRRALLPRLPPVGSGGLALDVGCGVGRWSVLLASRGFEVTGVDLSPYMLERARIRAAEGGACCSFISGDAATLQLGRTFNLILCVTVMQHILDVTQARTAIARLATHLAPGGTVVLLEAAPTRASAQCDTAVFRARTLDWYVDALRASGLTVIAQVGVDPMPFKTWLLPHYRRLPRLLRLFALALVTAISLPLDGMLGRWLGGHSWHKVLVVTRASDQEGQSIAGAGGGSPM